MKLYLDTSSDICKLQLDQHEYEYSFGRGEMAVGILRFIHDKLKEKDHMIISLDAEKSL